MVMFPQAACVVALRRPSLHWLKTLLQTAHRLYFATTVCTHRLYHFARNPCHRCHAILPEMSYTHNKRLFFGKKLANVYETGSGLELALD